MFGQTTTNLYKLPLPLSPCAMQGFFLRVIFWWLSKRKKEGSQMKTWEVLFWFVIVTSSEVVITYMISEGTEGWTLLLSLLGWFLFQFALVVVNWLFWRKILVPLGMYNEGNIMEKLYRKLKNL
ncbi:hypothetical protein [Persephonella sp.]